MANLIDWKSHNFGIFIKFWVSLTRWQMPATSKSNVCTMIPRCLIKYVGFHAWIHTGGLLASHWLAEQGHMVSRKVLMLLVFLCGFILLCPCNVDGHLLKLYEIIFISYNLLRFHFRWDLCSAAQHGQDRITVFFLIFKELLFSFVIFLDYVLRCLWL